MLNLWLRHFLPQTLAAARRLVSLFAGELRDLVWDTSYYGAHDPFWTTWKSTNCARVHRGPRAEMMGGQT